MATAGASETTGAWETSTVSAPSCCSHLARRPLSFDLEWSEEGGDRPQDSKRSRGRRGSSRDRELPGEQENAVDVIGSGQKTATGHIERSLSETGINPRIETGLPESESVRTGSGSNPKIVTARGKTVTEKTTASDALDRLITNGKRSESENDGHGHESCPTESGLYDPSLFLDPRIGKHGRIEKRSGPPKLLPTHHIAERAVMSGKKQPRKRSGRAEGVRCKRATSPSPAPEGAEETEARSCLTDERPETLSPSR